MKTKSERHKKTNLIFFDSVSSWGRYENPILKEALRRFKYHGTKSFAQPFSKMLADSLPMDVLSDKSNVVIPIPISGPRFYFRGYNQSEILARKFSENMKFQFRGDLLFKVRQTRSQTSLSGRERIINVKNCFEVRDKEFLKNKNVILVDDILTTGATLFEAAKVLREAGAKRIHAAVVARS